MPKGKRVTEEYKQRLSSYASMLLHSVQCRLAVQDENKDFRFMALRGRQNLALRQAQVCIEEEDNFFNTIADIDHVEQQNKSNYGRKTETEEVE